MLYPTNIYAALLLIDDYYSKVLVTGPQRSGTTIAARILSEELGFEYVDERKAGTINTDKLSELLKKDGVVIQCPAFSSLLHLLDIDSDTLVVFMVRSSYEISASQLRVNWDDKEERERYAESFPDFNGTRMSDLVYFCWEYHQRHLIPNHIELEYKSMSTHRLWVPKKDRQGWHDRQWKAELFQLPGFFRSADASD